MYALKKLIIEHNISICNKSDYILSFISKNSVIEIEIND